MALVASVVASFEWTIEAARELIRLQRENHDDFEFEIVLIKIWVRKSQEVGSWRESPQTTNNKSNSA
ncbi:10621_t:CDS:2 [Funneliformis geosporum]|uniref:10621_t:CDS:1 n=1 Tax=Funneliformis geosporum TaxID=1117311 RepID=A0A9W4SW65_9GLOM|nr:10621_t:CDS:2 [Funneliformis geosporum]